MSSAGSPHQPRPVSSNTTYALAAVAVVLIGLIVFAAFRWSEEPPGVRNDGYGPVREAAVEVTVSPEGVIRLGRPDAAKSIDIFEDPLCPACGTMETSYGQELAQKIDEGKLAVNYHFVAFLDPQSKSKDYSTRAIAANLCVAQTGSGPTYGKFHEALFTTRQPDEGRDDLSNPALATLATESGAPESVALCIGDSAQLDPARAAAATALAELDARTDNKAATPAIYDGTTKIDWTNENWVIDLAP
ncbi:serine/threonine protein kinase [Nocardia mangyaensis]|uniref:Serine/threonine protein kinase n=1 Tax=Nocardia mangyaensis TaxID=2213200 RepID=A0A1J0VWF7_9NOCA|nr:thioredoxin domain-containing protein [Nocardia mangyaensis]APE36400.1 serine/threonine protein kinase [Nocardia mangyaensis]